MRNVIVSADLSVHDVVVCGVALGLSVAIGWKAGCCIGDMMSDYANEHINKKDEVPSFTGRTEE